MQNRVERRPVLGVPVLVSATAIAAAVLAAGDRPAKATSFVLDAGEARLLCDGEAPRVLNRRGHTVVVPSNGPETLANCMLEIDFRWRGESGPLTVRQQWADRGFVEIMYMRDGAPVDPQRLHFKDQPTGISYSQLPDEDGYRVRFALDRLFVEGGSERVWALVGIRVRNGSSEQGYYSVSQTIQLNSPGTRTSAAAVRTNTNH